MNDKFAENELHYKSLKDPDLKEAVLDLMNEGCYQKDSFTVLVRKISKKNHFSEKERKILVQHLCWHRR